MGAGLALSEGEEDENDTDVDDDGSDGGPRSGAVGQNTVSCKCRPFLEVALIFSFYLGVPLGFVILWYDICFLRVYSCVYVVAHNRTICPCHRQHYILLTFALPRGSVILVRHLLIRHDKESILHLHFIFKPSAPSTFLIFFLYIL